MTIKLVACDIDGTLINKDNLLSEKVIDAVQKATAKGVRFCIATGRMFCSAQIFAKQLGLDTPIISYNGSLVKNAKSEEVYYSVCLDIDVAREVLKLCKENSWHTQKYLNDKLYVKDTNNIAKIYSDKINVPLNLEGDEFYEITDSPNKLMVIVEPSEQKQVIDELSKRFKGRLHVTSSNNRFIELLQSGVNKGIALKRLGELFNISPSEIMACGDSYNDLEMLDFAGVSVVTANADDQVKTYADFITTSCNEDGVAVALEQFGLL